MAVEPPPGEEAESPAEATLARALRCPPLSPEALARIRSAVASEWRTTQAPETQQPKRHRWRYAAAASLGFAVLSAWWSIERGPSGETVGVIRSHETAGLVAHRRFFGDSPLGHGASLRTGQPLTAAATTDVDLGDGGTLIILQGAVFTALSQSVIRLQSGSVYVDFDPSGRHGELTVRTPLGEVSHLGTQFEVTFHDGEERVVVREGSVRVTGRMPTEVAAGQAIVLDDTGIKATATVLPYDREWRWVEAATDAPNIEGETAAAFLHWLSRSTGKRLVWADDAAGRLAGRTILHGSIQSLPIDVAAGAVLATTSLHARIDDTTILVAADPSAHAAR